jgi:uncharacterized lipoprotein YehR (DUF1307 family)
LILFPSYGAVLRILGKAAENKVEMVRSDGYKEKRKVKQDDMMSLIYTLMKADDDSLKMLAKVEDVFHTLFETSGYYTGVDGDH